MMKLIMGILTWAMTLCLSGGISVQEDWSREAWAKTAERNDNNNNKVPMQEFTQLEKQKKHEGKGVTPDLPPPAHDPEIVIQPDVPADPDAVVVPPPIDPEMAVNPATREPMTKKQLEKLQEGGLSGEGRHEEKSIPDNK